MRVVMRADVDNVGQKGDVVQVSDGYARNYLVPRGLALKASPGAVAQAAAMRRSRELKEARDREAAEQLAGRLVATAVRIVAKAGVEGRLFGSVTAADIAAAMEAQAGLHVDRRRVHLEEPIRTVGIHEVPIRLHTDVHPRISVEVVAEA